MRQQYLYRLQQISKPVIPPLVIRLGGTSSSLMSHGWRTLCGSGMFTLLGVKVECTDQKLWHLRQKHRKMNEWQPISDTLSHVVLEIVLFMICVSFLQRLRMSNDRRVHSAKVRNSRAWAVWWCSPPAWKSSVGSSEAASGVWRPLKKKKKRAGVWHFHNAS